MNYFAYTFSSLVMLAALVASPLESYSQVPPDEHSEHHPAQETPTPVSSPGAMSGSMEKKTGGMMEEMHGPPPKEVYPSLIELPANLAPERRAEIQNSAGERIREGNALLASGFVKLQAAQQNNDPVGIREANEEIKRGQTLLESGVGLQKALSENKDPRTFAFTWFNREMNIGQASEPANPHGFFGLSWFHYLTMLTLAGFSAAMIWMYFRKMSRANALVMRLAGGPGTEIPLPVAGSSATVPSVSPDLPAAVNLEIAPSKSNAWTGPLRVYRIFDETPQVKTYRLTDPSGGKIPFNYLPGQFITVTVAPNGLSKKRSYTIASSPTIRDYCEITVKREDLGTVSQYLHSQVNEGDVLEFTGPSGRFTFTGQEADSIVLIAGGVGVTPLMSITRFLLDRSWKGDIFFLFACKSKENVIYREELEYLARRHPNLHIAFVLSVVSGPLEDIYVAGRITADLLRDRVPNIASRRVHICGPPGMIAAVRNALSDLGVGEQNIYTELFGGKVPSTPPPLIGSGNGVSTAVVNFARSRKTAILTPDKSILEASEDVGVNIDYSCRVGTCGICKTKLLSGKVLMAVEDALTDEDRNENIVLACQAKSTEDVAVDA
jgi:ferredoxin-NADP reductase